MIFYKTSDFNYELPQELIAERPAEPRDSARMLVIGEKLVDSLILKLPDYLRKEDILVFNNTKVIPARLMGKRGEAKIEINLNREVSEGIWHTFVKPAKRVKAGDVIVFANDFAAEVIAKEDMVVTLKFNYPKLQFINLLQRYGMMPLPPYIKRGKQPDDNDRSDYQTVFASREGAVAAPTAGLHFTERLFNELERNGMQKAFVTLHVGGGTFLPVKSESINDHKMHKEWCEISAATAEHINQVKAKGGRVVAIGTTSARVLESAAGEDGMLKQFSGDTDIFIYPGYKFKIVDVLLTNFHLPESTLLMLVSALAGVENVKNAYLHAVQNKYRFYSYGDCCLFFR